MGVRASPFSREAILALAVLGLGSFMLAQDLASLNVALSSIERDLNVDLRTVQWVVNAYLLVYGMVIVTGGRLADELGRRRLFLAGAVIFAITSLAGGFAQNVYWLIVCRALMGIGAGLMLPALSGMGYAVLPEDKAELAGGIFVGAYGIGMAAGPMIGGALAQSLGWQWIQFLNVPIVALVIFGVLRTIPPEPGPDRVKIDYPGIVTLSVALFALLFALDQAAAWGWSDVRIWFSLGLAVVLLIAFVAIERRAGADALVPADIVRIRGVSVICVLRVLMAPAYTATVLYAPQIMQKVLGMTPLESGVGLLPMLGTYAIVSFVAGMLAGRLSDRLAIILGLVGLAVGQFLVAQFDVAAGYMGLVAGLFLLGIGLGLFMPSSTTAAVKADTLGRKSLASGLVLMFQFVGGAIGLGLTTTIVASAERAAVDAHLRELNITLPDVDRQALNAILAGTESAQQVLQQFAPDVAGELISTAQAAFAAGVSAGLRLDAALAAAGVVVAMWFLRGTAVKPPSARSQVGRSRPEQRRT